MYTQEKKREKKIKKKKGEETINMTEVNTMVERACCACMPIPEVKCCYF